jgi:hypothetical protein
VKRLITPSTFARVIAAGLLFWAIAPHRYDYFTILRWVTCAAASYSAYVAYAQKATGWTWLMGAVALLFNPLVTVKLSRQTWTPIDIAIGLVLLISIWFFPREAKRERPNEADNLAKAADRTTRRR